MRSKIAFVILAAAMGAAGASGDAAAEDLASRLTLNFENGGALRLFGQLDRGVLNYNDGRSDRTYVFIDNANSNTRFGLRYNQDFAAWAFQAVGEIGYAPYSTAHVSARNDTVRAQEFQINKRHIRKLDLTFANDDYGKVWLGQGSMASDNIAEIDQSGTAVVAYASVGDSAGGQILRYSDPGLSYDQSFSGIKIKDAYRDFDGARRVRVRYDTPDYMGFSLSASYGRDLLSDNARERKKNLFDAALRYAGSLGQAVNLQAGVGYSYVKNGGNVYAGSVSALHMSTGLNLTVAAGGNEKSDARYVYGKLGLTRAIFDIGPTSVSVDLYEGEDVYTNASVGIDGSTSSSWGLAAVQKVDEISTDLYLTYRHYAFRDHVASYRDGQAIFGGVRFKF